MNLKRWNKVNMMMEKTTESWRLYFIQIGTLVLAASLVLWATSLFDPLVPLEDESRLTETFNPFSELSLEAKAAYVFDVSRQRMVFALNEEAQLPLASLTKLMTALVAREELPDGTVVRIAQEALAEEGDTGLHVEERWKLSDLLAFTLMVSSNDGAHALAAAVVEHQSSASSASDEESAFVDRMNETAADLGLTQSYFLNETGLDSSEFVSGGYGSARDVAKLFEHMLRFYPEILDVTRSDLTEFQSLDDVVHVARNTNDSLALLPGLIASKTGFTELAGGNLVIAFDAGLNRPFIITVLGSTEVGRFRDIQKLAEAVLAFVAHSS